MPQTLPTETLATLAEVGKDLYQLGLVTSHGGNLSVRVPGGTPPAPPFAETWTHFEATWGYPAPRVAWSWAWAVARAMCCGTAASTPSTSAAT